MTQLQLRLAYIISPYNSPIWKAFWMTHFMLNLFLHITLPYFTQKLRLCLTESRWRSDKPELTEEVWQVPTVISSRDKVIQTQFVYRSYYTPSLLFHLNRLPSAVCSQRSLAASTFYHMVWECPPIRAVWSEITALISTNTQMSNVCNPLSGLFGIIDDESLPKPSQIFLCLVFFYAKKSLAMHWNSSTPPTVAFWMNLTNQALPLYKLTYGARGCPRNW